MGEGGSQHVQYHPQESLDTPVERFLASLRFEQRGKLVQLIFDRLPQNSKYLNLVFTWDLEELICFDLL